MSKQMSQIWQSARKNPVAGEHLEGYPYCPLCGKKLAIKRIDSSILEENKVEYWLTKIFRQTLFGLFIAPGQRIRTFIQTDREVLTRPLPYLVLTAAVAKWTTDLANEMVQCDGNMLCQWALDNPVATQIIQAMLLAAVLRFVFFRNSGYNVWEFATLFVYLLAQGFLISSGFALFHFATGIDTSIWPALIARNAYLVFAVVQFFDDKSAWGVLKVVLAVLFAMMLFLGGALALALAMEWLKPLLSSIR